MHLDQRKGLFGGIALLAAATLVLEVTLTRLYSAIFGHHLAFLAISLSLFGVGLGSVLLYVFPALARPPRLFARLAYISGLTAASTVVALLYLVHGPSIEGEGFTPLARIALLYFVSSLPFVCVGLAVAAGLRHASRDVSRLYLFDMLGAAAGCLGAVAALRAGGLRAALVAAIIAAIASVVFALAARSARGPYGETELPPRSGVIITFVLASIVLLVGDLFNPWLKLPDLKYVSMVRVEFQGWNELALITVDKQERGAAWMRMDGGAATAILSPKNTLPVHPDEMGYVLHHEHGPVLIIGSGGGKDIRSALKAGQTDIDAAEINPIIVNDVMRDRYKVFSGGLYDKPEVHVTVADGRSFVQGSKKAYENIVLSLVDTWAASSVGALALTENSLYTTEAFADFIAHLAPSGTLLVNRWDREFDRLLSLAVAGLHETGVTEAAPHLFACSAEQTTSLLIKRTPLTGPELEALRANCRKNRFLEVFAPDDPHSDIRRRVAALGGSRAQPEWPLDLSAPTDDRPFFFYTIPLRRLPEALGDWKALEGENQGLLTLLGLLVVSFVLSLVFLLGPLLLRRVPVLSAPDRGPRLRALLFFLAIGGGFVCVELSLVQHFVMFLGHPVYALSTVLLALLLWTGVGSLLTARIDAWSASLEARYRAQALVGLLAIYAMGLGPMLRGSVALPLGVRVVIALILLAPLGLLMGSQAPLGVKVIASRAPDLIPWCWGLNGVASVFATALGTLLAMHFGFSALLIVGGAAYLIAAFASPPPGDRVTRSRGSQDAPSLPPAAASPPAFDV